jgi:ABC-type transport system involved in multi-copper enzyme maturation permease subunit
MKVAGILIFIIFIFLILPIAGLVANDLPAQYCLSQNNWKNLYSKNGITVYSQKAPDSDVLALKATGTLKAPLDQILEVLRQVEISKE